MNTVSPSRRDKPMGPQGSRAIVMAKDNGGPGWLTFFYELFKTEIYKRSQGRMVRQFTCLAIWAVFALAAWRAYPILTIDWHLTRLTAAAGSGLVLLVGLWLGFRVVNLPSFADFLIAVEAEMNKVSWPSRTELIRASMVVIVLMFGLTAVLFAYDVILASLLKAIGVVV
jgi:preprotein translocase subunit SecE